MPLNLSTKSYSSPSILNTANKSFLHYPFASLLSRAAAHQLPLYDSSPLHSSAPSPIKDYTYNRRQRERTTFDPHEETPRLLQIFTDTKHPTRYQIASICENLNALPCRKGRIVRLACRSIIDLLLFLGKKALEPYNIQYWFKNARAALKRKKRRFVGSETPTASQGSEQQHQQQERSPSPSPLHAHDEQNAHSLIKCELDSSDEIDGDDEDEMDMDDKQKQPTNNYYFNYLQAFDISLTDQQRAKTAQSDDSNDDDNVSSVSEHSPPTQISYNHSMSTKISNTTTSFDYSRSRRNRIFIDPTSEVPKLEQWFAIETHPDHILIERICSELNEGEYRTKFPKLESKHIRLWFKNHRAKVKRICRIQTPLISNETTVETTEKNMHNVQ